MRKILTLLTTLAALPAAAAPRDGAHDFDFNRGTWHSHIHRYHDPFAAPDRTTVLDATVTVRPLWNGRAWLEEIEAKGPDGPWEGMTLFLYDPAAGQWRQSFASSADGILQSPTIGSFENGVGRLYSQDSFKGRAILVKGEWSRIERDSHHYQESYSDDGGASWHVAFSADLTRIAP